MTGNLRQTLQGVTRLFRRDALFLPIFVLIDIVFLLGFSYVFVTLNLRIVSIIREVEATTSRIVDSASNLTGPMMGDALSKQEEVMQQLDTVTRLMLLLVLGLYILWCLFQGGSLSLVLWRTHTASQPLQYLWRFFAYNAVIFGIGALVLYLYIKITVFNRMYIGSMAGQSAFNWIIILLLLFLGYIIYVGYAHLGMESLRGFMRAQFIQPFRSLVFLKRYLFSVGTLLFGFLIFLVLFYLFTSSSLIFLSLAYLIVVLLPYVTYLRYLLLYDVQTDARTRKKGGRRRRSSGSHHTKGSTRPKSEKKKE